MQFQWKLCVTHPTRPCQCLGLVVRLHHQQHHILYLHGRALHQHYLGNVHQMPCIQLRGTFLYRSPYSLSVDCGRQLCILAWAAYHSVTREGPQLGLEDAFWFSWKGHSSSTLSEANVVLQDELVNGGAPPEFLVIHLRCNDIIYLSTKTYNYMVKNLLLYIRELLQLHSPPHQLCSSDKCLLSIPQTFSSYGNRAFYATSPRLSNSFPLDIPFSNSLNTFKSTLKTDLFKIACDN